MMMKNVKILISERQIKRILKEELTPKEIDNLKRLAASKVDENIRVAFAIGEPSGLGLELLKVWINSFNPFYKLDKILDYKTISLNNRNISYIPDSIEYLVNLELLDLGNNNLTEIPASIGKLKSLTDLYISKNHLITLPDSIGNLSNLEEISARKNNLTTIPDSIGRLKKLEMLRLNRNSLKMDDIIKLKKMLPAHTKVEI